MIGRKIRVVFGKQPYRGCERHHQHVTYDKTGKMILLLTPISPLTTNNSPLTYTFDP